MNFQNKAKELGKLQAQIYWLHDAEKFTELAKTANKIYEILGYKLEQIDKVGLLISEAYKLSDKAEIARINGDNLEEKKAYIQAKENLLEVENLLNLSIKIADYQIKWWMYFRHRNCFFVMINLFFQHSQPINIKNILEGLYLSYYLLKIGLAHNKRDLKTCEEKAEKYWLILLKKSINFCPFLG